MQDELKEKYMQICREFQIQPQTSILIQIENQTNRETLDLSTCCLSVEMCKIIAKLLATDHILRDISFGDCMLPEEGLLYLLRALSENVYLKQLNLKGNNIHSSSSLDALSKLIRCNHSIEAICLEWNMLGLHPAKFSLFAEALSVNTALRKLSLRNNQLNHECATALAAALQKNGTLRVLDIRWNNLKQLGGRSILDSLQGNHTLTALELVGNDIPPDIVTAVDLAIHRNRELQAVTMEKTQQARVLTERIRVAEEKKVAELSRLRTKLDLKENELRDMQRIHLSKLDLKESELRDMQKIHLSKISNLEQALDEQKSLSDSLHHKLEEQKSVSDSLSHKLEELQAELNLLKKNNAELEQQLEQSQKDADDFREQHVKILMKERKERSECEDMLAEKIRDLEEKSSQLQETLMKHKVKEKALEEEAEELRKQVLHHEQENQLLQAEIQTKLLCLSKKHQTALKELEDAHAKEVSRLKTEAAQQEEQFSETIKGLQAQIQQLEDEIRKANNSVLMERSQCEHKLLQQRQALKAEAAQHIEQLEDQLHTAERLRETQERHIQQQAQTISELQTKNGSLEIEMEKLKHQMEQLSQQLKHKDEELRVAVSKVQLELQEETHKLMLEQEAHNRTKRELLSVKESLKSMEDVKDLLTAKEQSINEYKIKLQVLESHIQEMKNSEIERASMLKAALTSYLSSVTKSAES